MSDNKTISVWRNPYNEGFNTTRARKIVISKGITVLTGCNGAGKTTLLMNIEDELRRNNIPVFRYDNESEGDRLLDKALFEGDFTFAATNKCSSEGEKITLNIGKIIPALKEFLKSGKDPRKRNIFAGLSDKDEKEETIPNERWILIDAIDSGYSIDNVTDLKFVLQRILADSKESNLDTYIVVSANTYEMVDNENCIDVISGKNVCFDSYEEYKKSIIKSREKKDKRYENK